MRSRTLFPVIVLFVVCSREGELLACLTLGENDFLRDSRVVGVGCAALVDGHDLYGHVPFGVLVQDNGDSDAVAFRGGVVARLEGYGDLGWLGYVGVEVAALPAEDVAVPGLDPVDVAGPGLHVAVRISGTGAAGILHVDLEVADLVERPVESQDLIAGYRGACGCVPGQGDGVVSHGAGEVGRDAGEDRSPAQRQAMALP